MTAINLFVENEVILLPSHFPVSDEDMDYLAGFNSSLRNTTLEMSNQTDILLETTLCSFGQFKDSYLHIHGHLAMVVCIFGTLFNLANILVLTHRDMRTNPINMILTGIAVADCLVMVEYIPFTIHMYLLNKSERDQEEKFSLAWGYFLMFHTNFSIMIHTVSIWLTLSLAIWRFIMIKFSTLAVTLCNVQRCRAVLLLGYIVPFFLTVPNFLLFYVHSEEHEREEGGVNKTFYLHSLRFDGGDIFFSLNMWFYSFFLKLLPCVVLTVFTASLIRAMYQAEANSVKLKNGPRYSLNTEENQPKMNGRKRNTDRTTRLLIVILVLFLIAEFPIGILGMLSAILGKQFFIECYNPVGEIMDMMALTNSAVNFILYCLMSSQFRSSGKKILGIRSKQAMTNIRKMSVRVEKYPLPKRNQSQHSKDSTFV